MLVAAACVSCGSSVTGGMTGQAGSRATAGSGGTSSATAGAAGTGGTTGAAGIGSAGTTGAAGTGTAGTVGTTGAAGTGTAGAAGRGGAGGSGATGGRGGMGGATTTGGRGGTGGATATGGRGGGAGGGGTVACQAPTTATGTEATVNVNLGTVRSTVSPELMGVQTSVSDDNLGRTTTPNLLANVGVRSLRYPGGAYADVYHWTLHTGTATPTAGSPTEALHIAANSHFGAFVTLMANVGANALITVNYGTNTTATGPARPQEAAAWVAYANGSPSNTTSIGVDADGKDWQTVGAWAGLRAAAPLATDDGMNFLRISHSAPVGIKYWEIGNEIYGNGYYAGGCGSEADLHVPYPATGSTCTDRSNNAALSPATYGAGVKAFSIAMKAVDPTIKIGGIVNASTTEFTNWNTMALPQMCASMDFAVFHWYAGKSLPGLLGVAEMEVPPMFTRLRSVLSTAAYNCPANLPIALTEWGPNTAAGNVALPMSTSTAAPVGSQIVGLFAAETYAHLMEQGALSAHWRELHDSSYLAPVDRTNDPFTSVADTPRWGYHGQYIAHQLASGNDKMVQANVNGGLLGSAIKAHASLHADGSIAVMITNTHNLMAGNVTVNVTGGGTALGCVGTRYVYAPINTDQDGNVTSAPIFSAADGLSVNVAVPTYATVVVSFPKR